MCIVSSVTSIGQRAFCNCDSLICVTIGSSVTSIGEDAFEYCYKLAEVINKSKLTITKGSSDNGYVGYYALNVKTESESGIVNIDGYLFYTCDNVNYLLGYAGNETSLTLPENYNGQNYEINKRAFYNCDSLASVTIPSGVMSIGSDAFYGCYKLVEVINNSKLTITKGSSDNGFVGKCALNVKTEGISDIVNKNGYLFYTYDSVNYLLGYAGNETSLTLPEKYNGQNYEIYKYAFYKCSSLKNVTIGSGVTSIGTEAFYDCDSIENIYYNGDINGWVQIKGLYNLMEYGKSSKNLYINGELLTEANITTATKINSYAFYNCSSLTSVIIGNSVTSIGSYAFEYCSKLTSVTFENPNGWYMCFGSTTFDLTLNDTAQNAKYLTSSHNYYWERK